MEDIMKKLILVTFISLTTLVAHADYGVEIGFRQQSGDSSSAAAQVTSVAGAQGGFVATFPVANSMMLRTGMLYTQRPLTVEVATVETKYNMNYIDFPVTALYKFEDYAGVFGGIHLSMNFDKSCDSDNCEITKAKSMITPFVVGASFKFAPQLGATIYYENTGSVAEGLENYRAVGANLMISVD